MLPRVRSDDPRATARAWEASRRLRELLPVLQIEAAIVTRVKPRLRRVAKRLAAVRQLDELTRLLDEMEKAERRVRPAIGRVRDDVRRLAGAARADLFRRQVGNDVRRVSDTLTTVLETLGVEGAAPTKARAGQSAVNARVVRRAADVKEAISAAGSVYLPSRLSDVRAAVQKLRYGAEVAMELADVAAADVRTLARMQTLLGRLVDVLALIKRVRDVQGSLATPDVKAWRDLDTLIGSLEDRCRGLHARYIRERSVLTALCDRLATRAAAAERNKRKVG